MHGCIARIGLTRSWRQSVRELRRSRYIYTQMRISIAVPCRATLSPTSLCVTNGCLASKRGQSKHKSMRLKPRPSPRRAAPTRLNTRKDRVSIELTRFIRNGNPHRRYFDEKLDANGENEIRRVACTYIGRRVNLARTLVSSTIAISADTYPPAGTISWFHRSVPE